MSRMVNLDYPFCLPSYITALDDGQFAQNELKDESSSWRSESYADDSHVRILDHDRGTGRIRVCNDYAIDEVLKEAQPQVRFILLLPAVQERIAEKVYRDPETMQLFKKNELYDADVDDFVDLESTRDRKPSQFNISQKALFKILTSYEIAPQACSHIRGQEQIYGSRITRGKQNMVEAFEFWYAIRARAYFKEVDRDADLKMTIITRYDAISKSTLVILKYRSFNDLPHKLTHELISRLCELVMNPRTQEIAQNPFAVSLLHFNCTAQWYRRAARDPRDSVRAEEEKAHTLSSDRRGEVSAIDVRRLHLTMRNLDQDKIQLTFIINVIDKLRKQHDLFYKLVKEIPDPDDRDWLYQRVEEEFDRYDNQLVYFRSLIEDISNRAQRLLDLLFNLSGQQNARWSEKVGKLAMHESASMKAIAIVSMLFLPGAFVSGLLGTNLFYLADHGSDSGDGRSSFGAASQWWILLVTIVPLTILTFAGWAIWRNKTEADIARKIAEEDSRTARIHGISHLHATQHKSIFTTDVWRQHFSLGGKAPTLPE